MDTTTIIILIIMAIVVIGAVLFFLSKKKGNKGPGLPEEPTETPVSPPENPTPQGE